MEGLERIFNDDMPEVIDRLQAELDNDPRNFFRHYLLGNAIFLNGDLLGAMHRYRMALDLNPDFGDVKLNLGYVLKLLDRKDDAIEMLEAFRREQPHSNKIEAAQKLLCELKDIPWQPKSPVPPKTPDILKPGLGRKKTMLVKERLTVPSLIFVIIILILIAFGLIRRDVLASVYSKTADTIGSFLSSEVKSDELPSDTEEESRTSEDSDNLTGHDLLARFFGSEEEEVEPGKDGVEEDPAKGPTIPEAPENEDENGNQEEQADPDEPANMNPSSDSYWPIKPGNIWKYRGYDVDRRNRRIDGSDSTGSIKVIEEVKGGYSPVYKVDHLGQTSFFYENSDGIYLTKYPDRPYSTGVPKVVKPVIIGQAKTEPGLGQGYEVIAEVDLRVPAGLFRTIQVKTWPLDYPDHVTEIFYAKGVGPVKLVTGSAKKGFTIREMTSYKLN